MSLPIWLYTLTDVAAPIQALFDLQQTTVWLALFFIILGVALLLARGYRSAQESLRAPEVASGEIVLPDLLREGWDAKVQLPAEAGLLSWSARIGVVNRRWMALTVLEGNPSSLRVGTPALVTVTGETAAYRFHTGVRDGRGTADGGTLFLERPHWMEKVQRRTYFRVLVDMPAALSTRPAEGGDFAVVRGVIRDLSAGGFCMALPEAFPTGAHVRLRIPDQALSGFSFDARVVRCISTRLSPDGRFLAQCEFLYVMEELRDRLVQYCFDLQRDGRKATDRNS